MPAVRLCGNAQPPNVQNVPQLTWILAQSPEKSTKIVKKSGDYAKSAISKDCRSITPTSKNIPQTSETVKEYVEKSIQILRGCGAI